jgi:tetratricopeptide (TPR) repeat protein
MSKHLPSLKQLIALLEKAKGQAGQWPDQLLVLKSNPCVDSVRTMCATFKIPLYERTAGELIKYVRPLKDMMREFKRRGRQADHEETISERDREEAEVMVPGAYDPCPCASGKKFRFCCQKIYKEIVFAMCAAEEGRRSEALRFMKMAEEKVGRTAEVVCRYAICWSYFDKAKSSELLKEVQAINPNHPRMNYIMGIDAVEDGKYEEAVRFYLRAIENYPPEDRYHLNETFNNLGTAYFRLKNYASAKDVWEKALVFLPTDETVKNNLIGCIYGNPEVPQELRVMSPFMKRFFE